MTQRYWYQDGWVVFGIVFVTGFLALSFYNQREKAKQDALPEVVPKLAGSLSQPLFGPPTLKITVWHQYPAALRNVVLYVKVNEEPAQGEAHWDKREHSFESWSPNQDQAVSFDYPLRQYDPNQEIHVAVVLMGKSIKPYGGSAKWLGTGWKRTQ